MVLIRPMGYNKKSKIEKVGKLIWYGRVYDKLP